IATDWANDGVFGDGWHLFGIGASQFEEATGDYEAAVEERLEELGITAEQAEEQEIDLGLEEPAPEDYGVWVPGIPVLIESGLESAQTPEWLNSLILDGIVGGVGAVLGFVPQLLVLFLLL